MLKRININQLREWKAYAELEPFGPRREDARAAQTSWMLAELHRDKKKRRRAFALEDFVLDHGDDKPQRRRPRKSWRAMRAIGAMMAASSGAKVPDVVPPAKDEAGNVIEEDDELEEA